MSTGDSTQATPSTSTNDSLSTPTTTKSSSSYQNILQALRSHPHIFISLPTSPHKPILNQQPKSTPSTTTDPNLPTISSLSLHPVIESILHLLNADLPSAHFLCRHAEVAPKWESMYVHGILHRIEGDIDNARAWYADVKDKEVFTWVWERMGRDEDRNEEIARHGWEHYLDCVERYRDSSRRRKQQVQIHRDDDDDHDNNNDDDDDMNNETLASNLQQTSLHELNLILQYCVQKFGVSPISIGEAREEFLGRLESGDEKHAEVAMGMVTGGEGWRVF